jgi:hypothetical protein
MLDLVFALIPRAYRPAAGPANAALGGDDRLVR